MTDYREKLARVIVADLPDCNLLHRPAREMAGRIRIGRSLFLQQYGVASELDYKRQAMRDGHIMYHAHIGLNDVDATAAALIEIDRALDANGSRLDRAGFAVDRRMGLPPDLRSAAAAETGPMLSQPADWERLAQAAPIQPHLGDFMIGQPTSVENTLEALRIGCTTVGNLSQYFTFEAPGWRDAAATAAATYSAIAILAQFRAAGTLLHSYLEDGYGALFRHCETVAAWAMLERYIVEELIGARLTHCIGGLTREPLKRAAWVLALRQIDGGDGAGSMIYGDTLSFGQNFETNRALTAEYLLWDILIQLRAPSGHAVLPLPVTEAIRIPSADEIIEAQLFGRRVEASARRLLPHVDFSAVENLSARLLHIGRKIYQAALVGLGEAGVDLRNPLQMLLVLKAMGAAAFEQAFADDLIGNDGISTDISQLSRDLIDEHRALFATSEMRQRINGKTFVVASTDVHVHAAGALVQLLSDSGARVHFLGAENCPQDVVTALREQSADGLLLSTHNGMALEYARQLQDLLAQSEIAVPVVMGGVLNQKTDAHSLPVPVVDELAALGVVPVASLPALTRLLPSH